MKEENTNITSNINFENLIYSHIAGFRDIESFVFNEAENQIEIICRQKSNMMNGDGNPDTIWKEIYTVEDGKIKLSKTISGTHSPPRYIQETIKFEDE